MPAPNSRQLETFAAAAEEREISRQVLSIVDKHGKTHTLRLKVARVLIDKVTPSPCANHRQLVRCPNLKLSDHLSQTFRPHHPTSSPRRAYTDSASTRVRVPQPEPLRSQRHPYHTSLKTNTDRSAHGVHST